MAKKKTKKESKNVSNKSRLKLPYSILNKIAIAILFILPLIYFASFLSGSKMIAGSDWLLDGYIPAKWLTDCIKHYGSGPLWNPNVFGGLPMGNPYSLYTLFYLALPIHIVFTYSFVLAIFLAGLGMYLYLKELRFPILISFLGGIAYMSCGPLLSTPYAGHCAKSLAAALFPFILLFLHKGLTKHNFIYFLIAGALGALSATHAHFQLTYYAGVVCAFYLLFHLLWQRKENKIKGTVKLITYSILALILAGGLVSIRYLPIFSDFGWGSRGGLERGYAFATSWSVPTSELLDLLTPHFSGLLNNYWGENYFKLHTEYLGILPLLLALIGIAVKRKEKPDCRQASYVRFFIGLGVVAILFALGGHTPFYKIPYYLLPRVNKFRAPSMAFYLVAFSVIVLAAYGIQTLIDQRQETRDERPKTIDKRQKNLGIYLLTIFGIVAIFTLVCVVGKESILSFMKEHFQPVLMNQYGPQSTQQKIQNLYQNYPYFLNGLGKALFLIALNSVLIILLAMRKLKLPVWILMVTPILIFDQWSIEKQFLKSVPHPKVYYAPDNIVNFLKNDETLYRVFPFNYEHTTDSYLMLHNVQSVGGYVSNPYHRYQDLIGAGTSVMFTPPNLVKYRSILDILNVKYVIDVWIPEDLSQYDEETQKKIENFKSNFERRWNINWQDAHTGLELVYTDRYGHAVYENKTALPRAWIVHNFKVLPEEQILEELKSPEFDPGTTVILEEEPYPKIWNLESGIWNPEVVNITKYTPNEIVCEAILASPGFLVLSENWHPNWKVFVDGKKEKIYIADYTLRAVYLPEGRHTVKFVYISKAFRIGSTISILFLIFFVGVVVWAGISKHRYR